MTGVLPRLAFRHRLTRLYDISWGRANLDCVDHCGRGAAPAIPAGCAPLAPPRRRRDGGGGVRPPTDPQPLADEDRGGGGGGMVSWRNDLAEVIEGATDHPPELL